MRDLLLKGAIVDNLEKRERERSGESVQGDFVVPQEKVKPSDYIKDLEVTTWVDQNNYLVRKLAVHFNLKSTKGATPFLPGGISRLLGEDSASIYSQVLGDSTQEATAENTSVAIVSKFSDFGLAVIPVGRAPLSALYCNTVIRITFTSDRRFVSAV